MKMFVVAPLMVLFSLGMDWLLYTRFDYTFWGYISAIVWLVATVSWIAVLLAQWGVLDND